jgi:WD40 repeat protein
MVAETELRPKLIMSSPTVGRQETTTIKPRQKFEGHDGWINGTIHLADGERMMTCSEDGSLQVWNLKSGKQMGEDWRDGDSKVWKMTLSPDGKKVVSGNEDGGVRLWDIDTGKLIATWKGHTETVRCMCWSRDGHRVVSGSEDGTAREWDVEKGKTILGPIETGHKCVWAVLYSPDMTMFATVGDNEESKHPIKIWDAKTGELVASLDGHTDSVLCLAWTPDGATLISGSDDFSIRTWNTKTWKQLALLDEHTEGVYDIAISPNGRILASASLDNTARLWNLENSQPISSPLHHAALVNCVSFSADGKLLFTGCDDKNAYTWDASSILKDAGLDELLLDQPDKSLLAVRETFFNNTFSLLMHSRLMLHDVLSVSQSRSHLAYPVVFSTACQIVLTYVVNYISFNIVFHQNVLSRLHVPTLYHRHRVKVPFAAVCYPYTAPHTLMHTIRHLDPALSIGFEIVSLPDQMVQI